MQTKPEKRDRERRVKCLRAPSRASFVGGAFGLSPSAAPPLAHGIDSLSKARSAVGIPHLAQPSHTPSPVSGSKPGRPSRRRAVPCTQQLSVSHAPPLSQQMSATAANARATKPAEWQAMAGPRRPLPRAARSGRRLPTYRGPVPCTTS